MADTGTVIEHRPLDGLRAWTHVIYALHAWTVIAGLVTSVMVVTAFLFGWPSLIAVVLNYVKRGDVRGTYLESHFRWQLRTFWFAVPWAILGLLLFFTFLLIPVAFLVWGVTGLWVAYRVARGWILLAQGKSAPV